MNSLPHLTNKQKEILSFLYRFRFLNRIQIQTLLKHKNSKNTNVWLKDLTKKNYIKRIYKKTRDEMYKPAIYYISTCAIKHLRTQNYVEKEYLRKLYQESRRSKNFIDQCIMIGGIYLELSEKWNDPKLGFKFYTQMDFSIGGMVRDVMPSLAYVKRKGRKLQHYACEIIKEGTPRYAMRGRIRKYLDFYEDDEMTVFYYLFICPDKKVEEYVCKHFQNTIEEQDITGLTVYVTTIDKIGEHGFAGEVWRGIKYNI